MKKILGVLFVAGLLLAGTVSAQTMMGNWQQSGNGNYSMWLMMSPQNYQQMQSYIQQLQQGKLSANDQQQMWQLMQNYSQGWPQSFAPGSQSYMLPWHYSMMGNYYGGGLWFGWITMVLVWALLLLGIAALIKWLKQSK